MKKSFFLILLVFTCSIAFSLPFDIKLSIEPIYQLKNGTLHEFVYAFDEISQSDTKLSQLDWPLTNISYMGINAKGGWKFIQVEIEYTGALTKQTGDMEDFDWQDYVYPQPSGKYYWNDSNMCTNKSINETQLQKQDNFRVKATFDINPIGNLYFTPSFGYEYNHYIFSAKNGYGWYGDSSITKKTAVPYTDMNAKSMPKGSLYGIDYERENYDIFIGTDIKYILNDRFLFSVDGELSIYSKTQSIDFHHSNKNGTMGTYFLDVMEGYFSKYSIGTSFEAKIWKGLSGSIDIHYTQLNQLKGITYLKENQKKFTKNDIIATTSRCSEETFTFSTGLKWSF